VKAQIPYDPALTVDAGDYLAARSGDMEARQVICDRVLRFLKDHPGITAIAATTDVAALGAIRAAYLLGKRVPDDLAVVGFDGISMGSLTTPALTTVAQPIDTIATRAMDLIIEQMQEGGVAPSRRHLLLEAKLVVRESCGSR
jgi:LacI family transcriptional regulator